jgi:formylglycine-generating enzyme required for sulfatase activity/TolB-like protein
LRAGFAGNAGGRTLAAGRKPAFSSSAKMEEYMKRNVFMICMIGGLAWGAGAQASTLSLNDAIDRAVKAVETRLPPGTKVAVLNFSSTSEVFSDYVIEELSGVLVMNNKVTVIERRSLDLIRQEMQLQLSGDVSDNSAQAIGKQLGAQTIVSGSLTNLGDDIYRFRIKAINVETARIEAQASYNLGKDRQVTFLLHGDQQSRPPETAQSARPALGVPAGFGRIPGGTFTMGSPASEPERRGNEVQHRVTVSSFSISKYEVTVGDFRRFVNATGYKTTAETSGGGYVWTGKAWETKADASWRNPYFTQGDNHPVVLVSWYDAVEYCNWVSRQEGLTPAYTRSGDTVTWNRSANGYRLPTEAEWEYACRAGTTTPFHTGNNITTSQANYDGNNPYNGNAKGVYREKTWAVGSGAANAWGLYDMHGNVWEWCWDRYGDYPTGAQTDPAGPASGLARVSRGGSWYVDGRYGRSACRDRGDPAIRRYDLGFRLARNMD